MKPRECRRLTKQQQTETKRVPGTERGRVRQWNELQRMARHAVECAGSPPDLDQRFSVLCVSAREAVSSNHGQQPITLVALARLWCTEVEVAAEAGGDSRTVRGANWTATMCWPPTAGVCAKRSEAPSVERAVIRWTALAVSTEAFTIRSGVTADRLVGNRLRGLTANADPPTWHERECVGYQPEIVRAQRVDRGERHRGGDERAAPARKSGGHERRLRDDQ